MLKISRAWCPGLSPLHAVISTQSTVELLCRSLKPRKTRNPAVTRENALQHIQFLLKHDLYGRPKATIFMSFERQYATFCDWLIVTLALSLTVFGTLPGNNPGQFVHIHVPLFTKQYNLVPVKGRWCHAAGKITVGLASHWPFVTDSSSLSIYGLNGHRKGDEQPTCPGYY